MSRGRKKVSAEEVIAHVDEIESPQTEFYAVEGKEVTKEEFAEKIQEAIEEAPVVQTSTIVDDRESTLKSVRLDLIEHSRRRPGSVSGMLPPVYRLVLPGGRARFFTLPINVEEGAVEDGWKKCRSFMTAEEYIAFVVSVVEIPRPAFYSSFRVITLD